MLKNVIFASLPKQLCEGAYRHSLQHPSLVWNVWFSWENHKFLPVVRLENPLLLDQMCSLQLPEREAALPPTSPSAHHEPHRQCSA